MESKELSLSRKGDTKYADKSNIDAYIEAFDLSPDNAELEKSRESSNSNSNEKTALKPMQDCQGDDQLSAKNDVVQVSPDSKKQSNQRTNSNQNDGDDFGNNKIAESSKIVIKLRELKSKKLVGLYYSLCTISLNKHPALVYVGAWSFFEVLSKFIGNNGQEFPGFYKSKSKSLGFSKEKTKDFGLALTEISSYGNAIKHSDNMTPISANQLATHFDVLEPLILSVLDQAMSLKREEQSA